MSANSSIEWTDRTWNPVTGCTKVSPGCAHCYAEGVAMRFWATQYPSVQIQLANGDGDGERAREFTDVQTHENRLLEPLSWRKPARVFVNSMSDLFHEDVPAEFIERAFSVMSLAERHTFQVLTKRPERMLAWFRARRFDVKGYAILQTESASECRYAHPWPLPNVWLGVSVENQKFLERVDVLKDVPAAVRFVSFEPLLEDLGALILDGIQWAIFGGESGTGARPCHVDWIRNGVRECQRQGCAPFVKQLGANPNWSMYVDGHIEIKDRKGGDMAEWPVDLRVREFPEATA